MDINMTFIGELVFYSMFIVGGLSYYLGKRKTSSPKIATFIGVLLCLTPPLNIVYLIVLMLKNNEVNNVDIDATL
ncbi:hypothetical protein [Colwellia sp. 12G3]|uniref:hypothetical protein n=1 Tax=Colwellia sp. 12G3 TaxID=2058299 RepID=UPI000C320B5C|nr:hypothetical protein [Colwellia sp. 12G3]PKI15947.1 hypothetical protein CXF71_11650 [Colwellia sp. 12G3]